MTGSSNLRRERKLEPFSLTFIRHLTLSLTSHYLLNMESALTLSGTKIHNYLEKHKQSVVVNGASSAVSGTHQGSILGPLLFLIYIDDVNLSNGSKIVLYADDSLLYCPSHCPWTLNTSWKMLMLFNFMSQLTTRPLMYPNVNFC